MNDDCLVSLALAAAARVPARPALIDAPDGTTTSYAELADRLLRVASSLSALGVRRGDTVATLTPNASSWVVFSLGTMAAGCAVTGLNPLLTPEEIARQIRHSGAKLLAVASRLLPMLEGSGLRHLVEHVIVLDVDGETSCRTLSGLVRDGRAEPVSPRPDDVALLPYSSGTSGLPKGVEVPGRSLAIAGKAAGAALGLTEADVWLAMAPFFHIVAVSGVLASALACGVPVVIAPGPDIEAALAAIARYRVTMTVMTPPALAALDRHPGLERYDLSSLRALGCTAAPLSAAMQTAVARRLDTTVFQAYGMTESVGAVTLGPLAAPFPGSCGRAVPGVEVRIVDPATGHDLPRGGQGEVWARSDCMMRGYRGDPEATAATITADGWLRTGDLGTLDADANLFVVDRLKELIKVGPSQVAPAELEALLVAYPGVVDAAVVGRPAAETGECPIAFVVASQPIDADALMAWVAGQVAPFKRLAGVAFVERIPRLPNGKILRRLLPAGPDLGMKTVTA